MVANPILLGGLKKSLFLDDKRLMLVLQEDEVC
jgi:hypothetical protein